MSAAGVSFHRSRSGFAARMLAAASLVLLAGCASRPQLEPAPEWDAVPAAVISALCERLKIDSVAHQGDLAIVRTTQPIVSAAALAGLARRNMKSANLILLAEEASAQQKTIPLLIPQNGCAWQPVDYLDRVKHRDVMVVELSSPIRNPFAREAGMFARVSLGGTTASWYWIPFRRSTSMNDWLLDRVAPLGVWE
jgi:hypothetical protein